MKIITPKSIIDFRFMLYLGVNTPTFFIMQKPKRSSDGYIQLKKITDKKLRNALLVLSDEKFISPQELCYRYISDAASTEMERRKRL